MSSTQHTNIGVCQKCYREDITTGDITQGVIKINLHSIVIDNFETIEGEVDRGHSRWRKYDYEIEKAPSPVIQKKVDMAPFFPGVHW